MNPSATILVVCTFASAMSVWVFGIVRGDTPAVSGSQPSGDHTPALTAERLTVREGFVVSLAVSEPNILDPVSAAWGSDGTLWVVEMPDYPQPSPGQTARHGRVRRLSDRDTAGQFQSSMVFAEGLDFATGVLPWQDGVIVTMAGQIAFLRDLDGDGRFDEQEVWFEGFTVDNQQLRANHPTLGPDGLVYVAGGLRGGEIIAANSRFSSRAKPLKLQGHDFVFDPHGGYWGTVSGNSQHGLTIDDFNRRFGCSNRNPAIQSTLPALAIDQDPFLTAADGYRDVARSAALSEVRPISNAWTTSNLHAGQFSAACGVYAPGWLADGDSEWLLVCEPTGSLVQRQRLASEGGIWNSQREAAPTEWLACSDDWFRPVDLLTDVGGGVLVIDMARAVIEHPHWAPPELKNRPDTHYGSELGRLWQVRPAGSEIQQPSIDDDQSAIRAGLSTDPLLRMMASAYWFERYSPQSLPSDESIHALRQIAISPQSSAATKARICLLLNRWGQMTTELTQHVLEGHPDRLRALAIGLREQNIPTADPLVRPTDLVSYLSDSSLLVRRAALEVLATSPAPEAPSDSIREAVLELAIRNDNDQDLTKLLVSLPSEWRRDLLFKGLMRLKQEAHPAHFVDALAGWMRRAAAENPQKTTRMLVQWLAERPEIQESQDLNQTGDRSADYRTQAAVMTIADAWGQSIDKDQQRMIRAEFQEALKTIDSLAVRIASDPAHTVTTRLSAIAWCGFHPPLSESLRGLLGPESESAIRAAAFRVLVPHQTEWAKQYLIENADSLLPTDRFSIVEAIGRDVETSLWLLSEIEADRLPRTLVDPSAMDGFRNHPDTRIAGLGRQVFAPPGDLLAVLDEYRAATIDLETADPSHGKALFAQHCGNCHQIDSVGHAFGPDISDSRGKSPDSILTAILGPSSAIDASFAAYELLSVDGDAISGLLAGEDGESVTLSLPGGQTRRVQRQDIEIFRAAEKSLMPEGFQRVLKVSEMRDLIAYLKRWRYLSTN